jgi:uncharacterized damage-inducible protein DinB
MSSTAALAATTPIATMFSFNDHFALQALEGLTQDELWRAPTTHNNPMLWVAGHVVQTRAMLLQMLGEDIDTGWGKLFDRGATLGDAKQYPSGAEVARVMREISPRLLAALSKLNEEQLNRSASLGIPGFQTLADELAFFALHDSYHVGQLAYIRKALGHPGIAG